MAEHEPKPGPEILNAVLQQELLRMASGDQEIMKRLTPPTKTDQQIIRQHSERLKEMIQEHGWPGRSLVGDDGARAAWLLVQHSDHDVSFQEHALSLLKTAAEHGEAERSNLACLTDRVRKNTGQPQLFGTQRGGVNEQGESFPYPIEDPEHVDERRAQYGLSPLKEYLKSFEKKDPL